MVACYAEPVSTYARMMRELLGTTRQVRGPEGLSAYVEKARGELAQKTMLAVQRETARTWAGRALVAKERGNDMDAHEYAHESIEHAALSGDNALLDEIRAAFDEAGVEY